MTTPQEILEYLRYNAFGRNRDIAKACTHPRAVVNGALRRMATRKQILRVDVGLYCLPGYAHHWSEPCTTPQS